MRKCLIILVLTGSKVEAKPLSLKNLFPHQSSPYPLFYPCGVSAGSLKAPPPVKRAMPES
jgi:hypothetical protein